jgi:hypothetical protein
MLTTHRFHLPTFSSATLCALLLSLLALSATSAQAQFSSGSTGADGAFNPTSNVTVTLPPSGVFNYTTVNIPPGVQVRYTRNALNTPITILAQGNVTISGQIIIDGDDGNGRLGGRGGPGGFRGGNGGSYLDAPYGTPGDGPGGGGGGSSSTLSGIGGGGGGGFFQNGVNGSSSNGGTGGVGGSRYGTKILMPLIGGSGGGGSGVNGGSQNVGSGGGGGGGAIILASSTSITFGAGAQFFQEGIYARGANHNSGDNNQGSGSGGAIRLVANTISGSPCLNVAGGFGFNLGGNAALGIVRVEGFDLSALNPQCSTSSITQSQPNPVTLANSPTLRIDSVGGVSAPANPVGLINAPPDIVVPTSVSNPVAVVVNATNLASGTTIQVQLTPESGAPTTANGTLTGSTSSSTTTVNMTLPSGGISVIRATVTLDVLVALGKPTFINGERVEKVEIASTFGSASELVYITRSGRRISQRELQH